MDHLHFRWADPALWDADGNFWGRPLNHNFFDHTPNQGKNPDLHHDGTEGPSEFCSRFAGNQVLWNAISHRTHYYRLTIPVKQGQIDGIAMGLQAESRDFTANHPR